MDNKFLISVMMGASFFLSSNVNALIIDNFNTNNQNFTVTGPTGMTGTNSTANRNIFTEVTFAAAGVLDESRTRVVGGFLDVANTTGMSADVSITWNNMTNLDLAEAGASTGFFLAFPAAIDNDLDITFEINGGTSTFDIMFSNGSFGEDFFIPFAEFSNNSVFSNVNDIVMIMSDGAGWDARIDFIETRPRPLISIPEPAVLSLFSIGMLGLVLHRTVVKKNGS